MTPEINNITKKISALTIDITKAEEEPFNFHTHSVSKNSIRKYRYTKKDKQLIYRAIQELKNSLNDLEKKTT